MQPILVAIDCEKYLTSRKLQQRGLLPADAVDPVYYSVLCIADVFAGRTSLYPTKVRLLVRRRGARNRSKVIRRIPEDLV